MAWRVSRTDVVGELSVGQTCVSISVNATHDGEELSLAGVVTALAKESTHVEGVNATVIVAVDAAVGSERAEVVAGLEFTLEDVETAHKVNLLLEDVEESALDVVRKRVEATNMTRWAVQSLVPQVVVRAGEHHLQETKK